MSKLKTNFKAKHKVFPKTVIIVMTGKALVFEKGTSIY
jgi:hypothetical protein